MSIKGLMKGLPKNIPDLEDACPICLLTKATEIPIGWTIDVSKFTLGSYIKCIFHFSMFKASLYSNQLL